MSYAAQQIPIVPGDVWEFDALPSPTLTPAPERVLIIVPISLRVVSDVLVISSDRQHVLFNFAHLVSA